MEFLKQPQYTPIPVGEQVAVIYCGTQNLAKDVPVESIIDFETEFIHHLEEKHADVLTELAEGKLTDKATETLKKVAADVAHKYRK